MSNIISRSLSLLSVVILLSSGALWITNFLGLPLAFAMVIGILIASVAVFTPMLRYTALYVVLIVFLAVVMALGIYTLAVLLIPFNAWLSILFLIVLFAFAGGATEYLL